MKWLYLSLGFVFAMFMLSGVTAAEPKDQTVTIPLNTIWTYQMPGTQDVRQLKIAAPNGSLVESIQRSLRPKSNASRPPRGFIGHGKIDEVVRQVYQVLVSGENAPREVIAGEEIWIVFFTYEFSPYVHLKQVERRGNEFVVQYKFVPHEEKHLTAHFALIPLGKLSAGKYGVSIDSLPMERKYLTMGFKPVPDSFVRQIVCRPFEFVITEPRK